MPLLLWRNFLKFLPIILSVWKISYFMKFTERFNECLKYSNLNQSEIAKCCNTTRQNISNFKAGRTYPSIETLYLLCECLDVSADYLLGLED